MKVLVISDPSDIAFEPVSLELITAARTVCGDDGEVTVAALGHPTEAKEQFGAADKVVGLLSETKGLPTAEAAQAALASLVAEDRPDLVLVAYSALGLDIGPWLAARCDMDMLAYVTGLERAGADILVRSQIYGGKLDATSRIGAGCVLSVTPGSFEAAPSQPVVGDLTRGTDAEATNNTRLTGVDRPELTGVDLTQANRILCVGRGIGDETGIEQARGLASALSAELAGSRPVVDGGLLEKLRQVGKSGQKVKPGLYLALGVSGAPEHLEGMAYAESIVAINSDPDAPIFNVAHYVATCDMFDFMDALEELLEENPVAAAGDAA